MIERNYADPGLRAALGSSPPLEKMKMDKIEQRLMADLMNALEECIEVWDRWYQELPRKAEDDEFGAFLTARSVLARAKASHGAGT